MGAGQGERLCFGEFLEIKKKIIADPLSRAPSGPQTLMQIHIIFTENQKSDDPQNKINEDVNEQINGYTSFCDLRSSPLPGDIAA